MAEARKRKFVELSDESRAKQGHLFKETEANDASNQHQGDVFGNVTYNRYGFNAEEATASRLTPGSAPSKIIQKKRMVDAPRNPLFTGRDNMLSEMYDHIKPLAKDSKSHLRSCVLFGLGGMGKTQIANEYFYRYQEHYDYMFSVQAEEGSELAEKYGAIALIIEGEVRQGPVDQRQNIKNAKDWLSNTDASWLLVFDNVRDMKSIERYIPASDTGSIIITTQLRDVELPGSFCFAVEGLSESDGSRLLRSIIDPMSIDGPRTDSDGLANSISQLVGGLPLAIAQIGGYIKRSQISCKEFIAIFRRRKKNWISRRAAAASTYDKTLQTVFDIALEPLNQDARDLINSIAFMNPQDIWEDIFIRCQEDSPLQILLDGDDSRFLEIRDELTERCLINRIISESSSTSNLSIHRSLKESLLYKLEADPAKYHKVFMRAFQLIRNVTPRQSPLSSPTLEWLRFEKYMPHVVSLCSAYEESQTSCSKTDVGLEVAELFSDIGNYMWERCLLSDAFRVLGAAEHICGQVLDPDDPNPIRTQILYLRASFELNHGCDLRLAGLNHKQQILDLRRKRIELSAPEDMKVDELQLSTALNNLGCAYIQCEDYESAEGLLNDALQIKLKWGDETSLASGIAEQNKNLALVAISKGKIEEALELSANAVRIITAWAGSRAKMTLFHRFIQASIIFNAGYLTRALEENVDILSIKKDVLDETDDELLDSYYAVGMIQHLLEDLTSAELSKVLNDLHKDEEAAMTLQEAHSLRDKLVDPNSNITDRLGISQDEEDEAVVFDQIVSCWAGRFGGKQNIGWQRKNAAS
ncbi:MAG: hypothetical protein Q9196_002582 [Gyalolechia fulgens]